MGLALVWAGALAGPVIAKEPADSGTLLTGAAVLSEDGQRLIAGRAVLVVDGRIRRIAAEGEIHGEKIERVDLSGLTLIPGLIDLHSHLLLHPYNETTWDDQVLRESASLRTVRATAAARATLEAGFTTLRDLGTEGAGYADVGLRDAIEAGIVPGPRLFVATRAIVATGCYGPSGFDPRWRIPQGAQEATGADEARRAVREQIAGGADWVKFYADYRRRSGEKPTPTFSQEEMNAMVQEAHSAGRPVAAHAMTDEGIARAVRAGVETIEHGYGASEATLKMMRERGVVLCPTLAAAEAVERYRGWKTGMAEPAHLAEAKSNVARAMKAGVTIACGSDVGVFAHGENVRELELMSACGMQAGEVLRAATATAAKVLRREKELGRIAEGYVADLVAVRGDPLKDVRVLWRPAMVMKDGRVVFRASSAKAEIGR